MAKTVHAHYCTQANLNLYDSPELVRLATQAAAGRCLYFRSIPSIAAVQITQRALEVCLCEDDYPGWLAVADLKHLEVTDTPYRSIALSEAEIRSRVPGAIAFAHAAMAQPNHYLWGGTVGPNYDCSGLVQAAFASVGIWLPRDAYQQEAFTQSISATSNQLMKTQKLIAGDLIFFGPSAKATHVGLYLGDGYYIHSSGKDQGRNGIGIDRLSKEGDTVSQTYYAQFRGAGRVIKTYQPQSECF